MGLDFFDADVTSAADGDQQPARIARCCDCGCLNFGVFQLASQEHFHLQCSNCGVSYCPGGCEPESTGQRRST